MLLFWNVFAGEYDALLPWPFQLRVTMMLMDQSESSMVKRNLTEVFRPDSRSASFKRPTSEMNTGKLRMYLFRPIWRRVPSADGPVGRWDGPPANSLSRLQTGRPICKHFVRLQTSATLRPIWRLFQPATLRRCDAGRRAYCLNLSE